MNKEQKLYTIKYLKSLVKEVPMPTLQFEHEKEVVLEALELLELQGFEKVKEEEK